MKTCPICKRDLIQYKGLKTKDCIQKDHMLSFSDNNNILIVSRKDHKTYDAIIRWQNNSLFANINNSGYIKIPYIEPNLIHINTDKLINKIKLRILFS